MSWTDEWIGRPHEKLGRGPEAFDCLGLFIALHWARFGRVIRDPKCSMEEAIRNRVVTDMRADVREVTRDELQEGDALLFYAGGRALHLGFALDAQDMLHTEKDFSCIERWSGLNWLGKLEGIYRFV
jgi:probable lipoprotein NlpC